MGAANSGSSAATLFGWMQDGYTVYSYTFSSGQTTYMASLGDIGEVTIAAGGGLHASNPTAGAISPGMWGVKARGAGGEHLNWGNVVNAALGCVGGTCEVLIGGAAEYFTAGTTTTFDLPLMIDGGVRVTTNATRLVAYFSGHAKFADAMPSNAGAVIGKGIDMAAGKSFYSYGYGQAIGGATNDFATFIYGGGSIGPLFDAVQRPTTLNITNYLVSHVGYGNGMYSDFSSLKK